MSRSWHTRVVAASVAAMLATGGRRGRRSEPQQLGEAAGGGDAAGILEHQRALRASRTAGGNRLAGARA